MQVKKRLIAGALLLSLIGAAGCNSAKVATTPGKPRDEKLIKITLACSRIEDSVNFAIKLKRQLLAQGDLTPALSNKITQGLLEITRVNNELNDRSLEFDSFTASRADLAKLFDQLKTAATNLQSDTAIPKTAALVKSFSGIANEVLTLADLFR